MSDFYDSRYDFSEEGVHWTDVLQNVLARRALLPILIALNSEIARRSKDGTILKVRELLAGIRSFSGLIPAQVFDEITDLVAGLEAALLAADDHLKSGCMAKIEAWHASKPAFIKHLPELRQMVFGK